MSGEEPNPYAAPQSDVTPRAGPDGGLWRQGRWLMVGNGAVFPDRCVKCNAPADGYRVKQKLTWGSWTMVLPRSVLIEFGMCPLHAQRLRRAVLVIWLWRLGAVALIVAGCVWGRSLVGLVLLGLLIIAISGLSAWLTPYRVSPHRIDRHFATLIGTGPAFLAELPSCDGCP